MLQEVRAKMLLEQKSNPTVTTWSKGLGYESAQTAEKAYVNVRLL